MDAPSTDGQLARIDLDPTTTHPADHLTVGPGAGACGCTEGQIVSSDPGRRTYVVDTSVLLSDPHALRRFAEHDVVL